MGKKQQALQMVRGLFKEASEAFSKNPSRAHRYVKLARKIAMKVNLKMPRELKRKFCKHCYKYLKHGVNARTRISKSRVVILCKECKKFTRIPLNKIKN